MRHTIIIVGICLGFTSMAPLALAATQPVRRWAPEHRQPVRQADLVLSALPPPRHRPVVPHDPPGEWPPGRPHDGHGLPVAFEPPSPALAAHLDTAFVAGEMTQGGAPPDTVGAVGLTQVVAFTNESITVQSRTGEALHTADLQEFWNGLGGGMVGDPNVVYDPFAHRWIATTMLMTESDYSIGIAVSVGEDATGGWHTWLIPAPADMMADQPLLGFSARFVTVQCNLYKVGKTIGKSKNSGTWVLAFDAVDLYAGGTGTFASFQPDDLGFSSVPVATWDAGVTEQYLVSSWTKSGGDYGIASITGAIGEESLDTGVSAKVGLSWSPSTTKLAPQSGLDEGIDPGDGRIHSAMFRNGSIWAVHTAFLVSKKVWRSAAQWVELRPNGVVQQVGRVDDLVNAAWHTHPSLAVGPNGDVLIGFSRMVADEYASAAWAFHSGSDAPGATQPVQSLQGGLGGYLYLFEPWGNRWGDYSATVADPADPASLWTVQEYAVGADVDEPAWGIAWGRIMPGAGPCKTDADCSAAWHCVAKVCTVDLALGSKCSVDAVCIGNHCVGGVCCNEACAGHCMTCTTGKCEPAHDGDACEDGKPCTQETSCSDGACQGGVATECDDGQPCTNDACLPAKGCVHSFGSEVCDDGDACTTADHCSKGTCKAGALLACPTSDECHEGTCDLGACIEIQVVDRSPCSEGECQAGVCGAAPEVRDDEPVIRGGCAAGRAGAPAGRLAVVLVCLVLVGGRRQIWARSTT